MKLKNLIVVALSAFALTNAFADETIYFIRHGETVPMWDGYDFDSIYVLKVKHENEQIKVSFELDKEDLNGQSKSCQFK